MEKEQRGKRMRKGLQRLGRAALPGMAVLSGLVFTGALGLLLLCEEAFAHVFQSGALLPNRWLFLIALTALGLGVAGWRLLRPRALPRVRPVKAHSLRWLFVLHAALLGVQLVYVRSLWFYPGWDPGTALQAASQLAQGLPVAEGEYFRLYPNNAPIAVLLSLPLRLGEALGLPEPYVLLPLCSALAMNLTSLACCLCGCRITGRPGVLACITALSLLWIGLSPYQCIPYTDAFAILFPVLALYVSLSIRRPGLRWLLVSLCCSLGALFKPTVLILEMAFLLWGGLRLLATLPRGGLWGQRKRLALIATALLVGYLPGPLLQRGANLLVTGSATQVKETHFSHYLMMGLNPTTYGGHSPEDVAFSQSFPTTAESAAANYQEAWARLSAMTAGEALRFYSAKLFKAYDSGTLAWNGSYLVMEAPPRQDAASLFLRSIYYGNGKWNGLYRTLYQGLWLALLALCALGLLLGRRTPLVQLLGLALLGLTLYQVLFECWPRYLFLYIPLYLLLGATGVDALIPKGPEAAPQAGSRAAGSV